MRSFLFAVAYWFLSVSYSLMALVLTLFPGRKPVKWIIQRYTRRMVQAMRIFAGIRLEVRGRENIPGHPVIFACKHHSWGMASASIHNLTISPSSPAITSKNSH